MEEREFLWLRRCRANLLVAAPLAQRGTGCRPDAPTISNPGLPTMQNRIGVAPVSSFKNFVHRLRTLIESWKHRAKGAESNIGDRRATPPIRKLVSSA
jgi:hypothetical protein